MAVNPNDPFSDPFRPGRQAAQQGRDIASDAVKRNRDIIDRTNATTAATIKRNADLLEENRRRDAFTKQIQGSPGNGQSVSGIGAVVLLLLPLGFLVVIVVIGFAVWKMMS